MLTFILTLTPVIWLMSLLEGKQPHISHWNNREEHLQFERQVEEWKYAPLM